MYKKTKLSTSTKHAIGLYVCSRLPSGNEQICSTYLAFDKHIKNVLIHNNNRFARGRVMFPG